MPAPLLSCVYVHKKCVDFSVPPIDGWVFDWGIRVKILTRVSPVLFLCCCLPLSVRAHIKCVESSVPIDAYMGVDRGLRVKILTHASPPLFFFCCLSVCAH